MSIVKTGAIWDLHIHTPHCKKGSAEFSKLAVDEYVDNLAIIFKEKPRLELISFTDHNFISKEVYSKFLNKQTSVQLIPGVEVDVVLNGESEKVKHVIFYFDIDPKSDVFSNFVDEVNKFLPNNNESVKFTDFVEKLLSLKVAFLISPHAFGKQGSKSITSDWNDPEITEKEHFKYMDQFFCFWEASGFSSISKGREFLLEYEKEERLSIISFSDSNNFEKLQNYLNNPPQYFNALPKFKGLQLVATDVRRVTEEQYKISNDSDANTILSVKVNGEVIEFSDRLNVIIGGRGSGKSILLDTIASNLQVKHRQKIEDINSDRADFIDSLDIFPIDKFGNQKHVDVLNVDYYNQSYVSKIFNDNDGTKLTEYFDDEFKNIENIDSESETAIIKNKFKEKLKSYLPDETATVENIANMTQKYILGNFDSLKLNKNGNPLKKNMIAKISFIDSLEIKNHSELILKNTKIVPKQLKDNKEILKSINCLTTTIIEETEKYNNSLLINYYENLIIEKHFDYNKNQSESLTEKNNLEEKFKNQFNINANDYIERVAIVKTFIDIYNDVKYFKSNYETKSGKEENSFKFAKESLAPNLITYFLKKCDEFISNTKAGFAMNLDNLEKVINIFCYDLKDNLKDSKTCNNLMNDLKALVGYEYSNSNKIYYKIDGNYEDIKKLSPGTQTNILMEYIVFKDTNKPLLIDQPEDNIDNETIFGELTSWFNNLKYKRQIIVVTHDANIVINADAENVIISNQQKKNQFKYQFGALEFEDNLNKAAIILDGGKKAVERRLRKYGE